MRLTMTHPPLCVACVSARSTPCPEVGAVGMCAPEHVYTVGNEKSVCSRARSLRNFSPRDSRIWCFQRESCELCCLSE